MDSLTQIVLGAAVGEAVLGKKIGNKGIAWGAFLGTLPDLDVIPSLYMGTVDQMSFHRGFSHSIIFCVLAAPLFGWLIEKIHSRSKEANWKQWSIFSFWVLFTHPLLDSFTSWGTQLFWPSNYRVAWNTIFVADPLYTIPFLVSVIALMFFHRTSNKRKWINYAGLTISTAYLLITVINKQYINNAFESSLSEQNIDYKRYTTKPTPLNNILWYSTIEVDSGYYYGYYSLMDKDKNIDFQFFPGNHDLLSDISADPELRQLLHLMKGYYMVVPLDSQFLIHDLRFGQITDFKSQSGDFVFSFHVENPTSYDGEGLIIENKRRFVKPEGKMFADLLNRMKGLKPE